MRPAPAFRTESGRRGESGTGFRRESGPAVCACLTWGKLQSPLGIRGFTNAGWRVKFVVGSGRTHYADAPDPRARLYSYGEKPASRWTWAAQASVQASRTSLSKLASPTCVPGMFLPRQCCCETIQGALCVIQTQDFALCDCT